VQGVGRDQPLVDACQEAFGLARHVGSRRVLNHIVEVVGRGRQVAGPVGGQALVVARRHGDGRVGGDRLRQQAGRFGASSATDLVDPREQAGFGRGLGVLAGGTEMRRRFVVAAALHEGEAEFEPHAGKRGAGCRGLREVADSLGEALGAAQGDTSVVAGERIVRIGLHRLVEESHRRRFVAGVE
jgi:hypothetical protein